MTVLLCRTGRLNCVNCDASQVLELGEQVLAIASLAVEGAVLVERDFYGCGSTGYTAGGPFARN